MPTTRLAGVEDAARTVIANHYDLSRQSIQLDVPLEASEDQNARGSTTPSDA